jgi:hypothetical protein
MGSDFLRKWKISNSTKATDVKIEFVQDGKITVLKESTPLKWAK